jgi:hypothetical protein
VTRAQRKIPEGAWPRLMSAERCAAYCDVSRATFLMKIAPRLGSPVLIGTRKLYDRAALDKWLDERAAADPDWLKDFDQ